MSIVFIKIDHETDAKNKIMNMNDSIILTDLLCQSIIELPKILVDPWPHMYIVYMLAIIFGHPKFEISGL